MHQLIHRSNRWNFCIYGTLMEKTSFASQMPFLVPPQPGSRSGSSWIQWIVFVKALLPRVQFHFEPGGAGALMAVGKIAHKFSGHFYDFGPNLDHSFFLQITSDDIIHPLDLEALSFLDELKASSDARASTWKMGCPREQSL